MNDKEFVLSGSKSQQLRNVVEQLRREGKVVLVVKPGERVAVLDSDLIIYDEDLTHWEWNDYVQLVNKNSTTLS